MKAYPLALDLAGRPVAVVGGGRVALRRVTAMLEAGAFVRVIAPDVNADLAGLDVTVLQRPYRDGDLAGAWLAHAATDDADVNGAVAAEADRRRIWCIRADDAAASSAWAPAATRYGDISVAVTAGGDPRRAQRLRAAIALALAEGSLPVRPQRRPAPASGRPDRGVQAGHAAASAAPVSPAPASPAPPNPAPASVARGGPAPASPFPASPFPASPAAASPARGGVALVGGGPGDPGLLTVRGRRLLAEADVVVADHLAPRDVLAELDPDVEVIDAGKAPGAHTLTQDQINELLTSRALAGQRVVRLKGGDPFVFGRGGEEALACVQAGVPVTVVPGVTSAVAVPASAGIPVTHRGVTQDFAVVSAHLDPSHPGATVDWAALAQGPGTLILLMAVGRLEQISRELVKRGRDASTPVAVICDGTTPRQRVLTSTLGEVADDAARQGIRPPAVVVVGDVVRLRALLGEPPVPQTALSGSR
ncbi:MAG: uroporphyrinogen-III C-methyltransferase [Streptosporangiaceae bacterium]|jgi:uroporphyrin-III C-methyltransferase/precorrin-2 dehydrogenase/sirohydrochlorin ferrochelatase